MSALTKSFEDFSKLSHANVGADIEENQSTLVMGVFHRHVPCRDVLSPHDMTTYQTFATFLACTGALHILLLLLLLLPLSVQKLASRMPFTGF